MGDLAYEEGISSSVLPARESETGWPKGILATDHKILVIALRVLKTGTPYIEPGGDYFDRLNPGLVQRLEALGHRVQLVPIEAV